MSTTIDNLDIQISTTLTSTDKALDNLITKLGVVSSSLSRISGTTSSVSSGMTKVSTSMNKTTKSTKSLASAFGSFYANYFMVIRGIKSLYKSITGTADYIEAFNYFEVSFNKIASEWKQDYEKFGYENAETYAKSFTERAKASLSKLSGVQIDVDADGKGLLTETGMKNLGLNIQEITQYASQLASVTNSVGQTGEVSLRTSTAFTKLAGDISSLFNVDYSSVATNLQSGLIGQSRALYKYGIDITNATLQTYAYELGLEKAVSEMTQAEKMQLRMIAILDQSKVSWGDLANTINSPSNMIRQFTTNLKEAGTILGQLFIPLLGKVLPVVNGVTIAIKRLLANIAGILGIKLDLSSFGQGASDLGDSYGDLSDSLDDVANSAEKAKAGVRKFDELKTIDMPKSSSSASGLGDTIDLTNEIIAATEEYERVWQEAYDKMEQKAQAFADTIEKMFKPIEKLFQDIKIGDWFAVGQDVSGIVSGIFNFFADAIDKVDWYGLGTKMGDFLAGINWIEVLSSLGNLIWQAIEAVIKLWAGSFSAAPIETAIITGIALLKWTGLGTAISTSLKNTLGTALTKAISSIAPGLAGASAASLTLAFSGIILGIPTMFVGIYDAIKNELDLLNASLITAGGAAAGAGIGAIIGMLGGPIGAGIGALIGLAVGLVTDGVILIVQKWDEIKEWFSGIGEWFSKNVIEPIKKIWEPIANWFDENFIQPVANFFVGFATRAGQIFEGLWIIIQAIWIKVSGWFDEHVVTPLVNIFAPIIEKVSGFFGRLWDGIKAKWTYVSNWFSANVIIPIQKVFQTACDKIGEFFSKLWSGIKKGVVGAMNSVIGGIETGINFLVSGINKIIKGFNKIVSWAAKVAEVDWGGVDLVPKVSLTRISMLAQGGYVKANTPQLAIIGDNKKYGEIVAPENKLEQMALNVANMVNNNGNHALVELMKQNIILLQKSNELLMGILEKEIDLSDSTVGRKAQRFGQECFNRTGNNIYSY